LACLTAYEWPGNVRELDNVVQRALVLGRSERIELAQLPADLRGGSPLVAVPTATLSPGADMVAVESLELAAAVEAVETRYIAEALRRSGDNKRRAAAMLGISERSLWYKLERGRG
jgi:two-component system response regulator AtoC